MADTAIESVVAHMTPVVWRSRGGYTYEGDITAGPDGDGLYTIVTTDGAVAHLQREEFRLKGEPPPGEAELTPEQRDAARQERFAQAAERLATDAMMSAYSLMRETLREELELEQVDPDDLRVQACQLVRDKASSLFEALVTQIRDKQSRPAPEVAPGAGTDESP